MVIQRNRAWVEAATAEQIAAALAAGEFEALFRGDKDIPDSDHGTVPQRDDSWVKAASPDDTADAFAKGELGQLLGRVS